MASAQSIIKAKAVGLVLQEATGQPVSYDYADNYIRIYWQPDRLQAVQKKLSDWTSRGGGASDLRVDWLPAVAPLIAKKTLPIVVGIFVAGYLLGRNRKGTNR